MCKISIVLPAYNRKYCLGETIESSLQNWHIRYIRLSQNVGASESRNVGIREPVKKYMPIYSPPDVPLEENYSNIFCFLLKHLLVDMLKCY